MPLLSYFCVVGSALIGLLYLANAVLPNNTQIHNSNIQVASQRPRQSQHAAPVPPSSPRPTMSFAAVPVAAPERVEEPTAVVQRMLVLTDLEERADDQV